MENWMKTNTCSTPGRKIRSKGQGRGMAVGGGRGPVRGGYTSARTQPPLQKVSRSPIPGGSVRNAPKQYKARFGKPVHLFADYDRDRVANVFDCKPFNPKKQDVIAPPRRADTMMGMYGRQEQSRQERERQREYQRQLAEQARRIAEFEELERQQLAELQRLSTPVVSEKEYQAISAKQNNSQEQQKHSDKLEQTARLYSGFGSTVAGTSFLPTSSSSSAPKTTSTSTSAAKTILRGTALALASSTPKSTATTIVKAIASPISAAKSAAKTISSWFRR
jgi:hypothetical protein